MNANWRAQHSDKAERLSLKDFPVHAPLNSAANKKCSAQKPQDLLQKVLDLKHFYCEMYQSQHLQEHPLQMASSMFIP